VIRPSLTLASIYGADHLYVSRVHSAASRWFTNDPALQDWLTGNLFSVSGNMSQLCSVGGVSAGGLELLREAGLDVPSSLYTFRREPDAIETLRRLVSERACKVVFQHVYPADVLPDDCYWINRGLLSLLNNKGNLGQLVAPAHAPQREVLDLAQVFGKPAPAFPFVLKAATDQSTGAGLDVFICRRAEDFIAARDHFAGCPNLVVEEFLHIEANLCLHYAVLSDGTTRYLGWAQQVSDEAGKYKGNWIFGDVSPPQAAVDIGHSIVSRAASLGYRGVAGIDMAVLESGAIRVFDLNFRVNGSTPAVLLADSIVRRYGRAVMRFRRGPWRGDFQSLLSALHAALRRGVFLPLGIFHPQAAGYESEPPRISGVILGESEQDVGRIEAELTTQGLV
jgi:hypothetical protein